MYNIVSKKGEKFICPIADQVNFYVLLISIDVNLGLPYIDVAPVCTHSTGLISWTHQLTVDLQYTRSLLMMTFMTHIFPVQEIGL